MSDPRAIEYLGPVRKAIVEAFVIRDARGETKVARIRIPKTVDPGLRTVNLPNVPVTRGG